MDILRAHTDTIGCIVLICILFPYSANRNISAESLPVDRRPNVKRRHTYVLFTRIWDEATCPRKETQLGGERDVGVGSDGGGNEVDVLGDLVHDVVEPKEISDQFTGQLTVSTVLKLLVHLSGTE